MATHQEPYAIDTDRHRSRVVISPQAATEPEYTLEKKGHTSVIRVSYPGPGGFSTDMRFLHIILFFPDVTSSSTPPGSRTPDGAVGLSSFQVIPNVQMNITSLKCTHNHGPLNSELLSLRDLATRRVRPTDRPFLSGQMLAWALTASTSLPFLAEVTLARLFWQGGQAVILDFLDLSGTL